MKWAVYYPWSVGTVRSTVGDRCGDRKAPVFSWSLVTIKGQSVNEVSVVKRSSNPDKATWINTFQNRAGGVGYVAHGG